MRGSMMNMVVAGREDKVGILKEFNNGIFLARLMGPFVELLVML